MKDEITDTWNFNSKMIFQLGFSSLVEGKLATGSDLCVTLITNGIR